MTGRLHSILAWTPDTAAEEIAAADAVFCATSPLPASVSGARTIVRPTDESEDVIRALVRLRPLAVALMDCRSGADVQRLDVLLSVAEAEEGLNPGATPILAWTDGMLPRPYDAAGFGGKSPRLSGLVWDWRTLARLLGAERWQDGHGSWTEAFSSARTMTLMAAKAAGVAAYEVAAGADSFAAGCEHARADGFDGCVAVDKGQVAIINQAFRSAP